jgi:membrane protease YdiL (CAAX protease family)
LARRIAAALGIAAAPQELPLESRSTGGRTPLSPPTYQHAPGHVDYAAAPEPPAPKRGYTRLFGPSLALSLMALPSLAHGNPFAPLAAGFHLSVSLPLALLAAVIALARLPVTNLLVKTNPHSLGEGDGGSDKLAKLPLAVMPLAVFFFAACEEITFRGLVFGGGVMLAVAALPAAALHPVLLYAAIALASSVGFAYMHRYSEMWPRLIGGLVYCAAFAMTGSLMFPTLIHTFYNLTLLVQRKRELAREEAKG